MPPAAVALAALLHVVAAAALLAAPLRDAEPTLDVIEVSMEQEPATPPEPKPPEPKPPEPPLQMAAPAPPPPAPVPQQPPPRMGLRSPPIGTSMDPRAPLTAPQVGAAEPETPARAPTGQDPTRTQEAREEAKPEPPQEIVKVAPPQEEPVKSEPVAEQQLAALAPQPPSPTPVLPKLENALPPVEAPPPPVSAREIPAVAPPPPPPPPTPAPQPAPRPQALPPPAPHAQTPQQQLAPSPLHPPPQPQQRVPDHDQQASRSAPSTFVNPADAYGQRKSQEDYLWGVVRKISQHRYYPKSSRDNSEEGMVVTLVTIARDGRLLGVTISRSSGYRNLDNAVLEVIRQAAPYPPLPNDLVGDRHTFVLPLNYKRTDPQ
jgi:TonB family protein